MKIKIAPSVLACDFARLGEEVTAMEQAGADMIHLDIMDGHFVPNISFGAPVVAALQGRTRLPGDVHLMLTDPLNYVEDFAKAGATHISFHAESASPVAETLDYIHKLGMSAGLVLKPGTDAQAIAPYLDRLEMVLVMTVEPGFGGQKLIAQTLPKIAEIRRMIDKCGRPVDLQVDGGIDLVTAATVASYGANVLVAGSSLFSAPEYRVAMDKLRYAAQACTEKMW